MDAQAYILIATTFGKTREVSNKLMDAKYVEIVHELYGQYDVIVRLKAPSIKLLEEFIQKNIKSIEYIERTETLIVSDAPS